MSLLVWGVTLGLLSGLACNGRVRNLANWHLQGGGLLMGLVFVQVFISVLGEAQAPGWVSQLVRGLWLSSFVGVFVVAIINLRQPGMPALAAGALANVAAILPGGNMPVAAHAVVSAGGPGNPFDIVRSIAFREAVTAADPRLLLADIFPLRWPGLLGGVVSVGDVLIMLGISVFIMATMTSHHGTELVLQSCGRCDGLH
ncbi:MAG: hypothetical protein Kow0056_15670 [Coriobacteriia bacterium]